MKPTVEDVVRILTLYAKLREMLFQIEMDLGIEEMTETERKVLAGCGEIAEKPTGDGI